MFHTLIAEDNVAYRQSLRDLLVRHFPFMAIHEATNGNEALDLGESRRHDLVFMDIKMPGHNGLDVTRAIKAGNHDAVVCIITSYDLPEYRNAAKDCGADYFIVKDQSTEAAIVDFIDSILAHRL